MKSLLTVFAILGLGTATVAFAEDAPAENACNACAAEAPADCSTLEGEEKSKCEEAAKAEDAPKEEKKGGKQMKKSDDGNMEKFAEEDE